MNSAAIVGWWLVVIPLDRKQFRQTKQTRVAVPFTTRGEIDIIPKGFTYDPKEVLSWMRSGTLPKAKRALGSKGSTSRTRS